MSDGLISANIFFDPTTGLVRNFPATPLVILRTQSRTLFRSALTPVGDTISLGVYALQPRGYIGVKFFDSLDETVAAQVDATAGSVALSAQTAVTSTPEDGLLSAAQIVAASPITVTYTAPVELVQATPSGVAGAAGYRLFVFTSET